MLKKISLYFLSLVFVTTTIGSAFAVTLKASHQWPGTPRADGSFDVRHEMVQIIADEMKKANVGVLSKASFEESLDNFLKWYQQLVAESLGKKGNGIFPIISNMPKDNHSLMQLYLDGNKNNFYTFFYTKDRNYPKLNQDMIPGSLKFLKRKDLGDILYSKILATKKVFQKKNIPFRSFEIKKRDEKTLGELFSFFILETILLGKALKLNPYDQPAVELIKKETKKILT